MDDYENMTEDDYNWIIIENILSDIDLKYNTCDYNKTIITECKGFVYRDENKNFAFSEFIIYIKINEKEDYEDIKKYIIELFNKEVKNEKIVYTLNFHLWPSCAFIDI